MSLSGILNKRETTEFLREHIRNPGIRQRREVVVRPTGLQAHRLGTAFDYAVRLALSKALRIEMPSIAESIYRWHSSSIHDSPRSNQVAQCYWNASDALRRFRGGTFLTRQQARGFLWLAAIDPVYRARHYGDLVRPLEESLVDELLELYAIVPWDEFIGFNRTVLNPTFGEGSRLLLGADADLVVDDVIVDFKVTKRNGIYVRDIRQLVGYALLAQEFGINGEPSDIEVGHIAIYNARTGGFHVYDLDECISVDSRPVVLRYLLTFYTRRGSPVLSMPGATSGSAPQNGT